MLDREKHLADLYDDIEHAVGLIKEKPTQSNIAELQNALNRYFNDSTCNGVMYTSNIDKLFFGLYIMPIIPVDDIIRAITVNMKITPKEYYVELDSKLFGEYLGLTVKEITAVIVHDISHLVGDSSACEEVKKELDQYLADNDEVLKLTDSIHYKEILSYGFRDAMRKVSSIFEKKAYEPDLQDSFITWCSYTKFLSSAYSKISNVWYNYNKEVDNKFIVFAWVLRLYNDVKHYRIPSIVTIQRCKELTPSKIEKKELDNLYRRLIRIDDDMLLEESAQLLEEVRNENNTYIRNKSLIETIEDEITGIQLDKDAAEFNSDANAMPDLLDRVNRKMCMIKDYVDNDTHLTKAEFKQWNNMYRDLGIMRNQLSNGDLYQHTKRAIYRQYKKL